ncbi:MAG: hypothetical protein ACREM1_23755 [Longimicrobiales bacterium]
MPLLVTLVVIALVAIGIVVYVEGRRATRDTAEPAATRPPAHERSATTSAIAIKAN